jgi:hypothetical protein
MEEPIKNREGSPQELPEDPQEGYTPRPTWQVWLARIGLVIFILFVIYQIFEIATGGQYAYPWN